MASRKVLIACGVQKQNLTEVGFSVASEQPPRQFPQATCRAHGQALRAGFVAVSYPSVSGRLAH
jgi:hypothetical protein